PAVAPLDPGEPRPVTAPPERAGGGLGSLRVSDNGRYLQFADGRPFFYLADTGWEMFHRASREDAREYLDTRAAQGFTVIQAVALAEKGGLDVPTPAGHLPLEDEDPARPAVVEGPDNDYWDDVDYMIDYANSKGMFVAIWVAWGSMVSDGPEVLDADNADDYGRFLGERYKDRDVLWVLGGDREAHEDDNTPEVWGALAEGIRETDTGRHLMSFHPWGEESSTDMWPNDDTILDFNMIQGGHKDKPLEAFAAQLSSVYAMEPPMPVLDGEVVYEEHPINWDSDVGWHVAADTRGAAYYQVFAGAFGHAYGDGAIHQFWEPGMDAPYEVRDSWRDALHHEGAGQMQHLKRLMLSRSYFDRIPDQSLVTAGDGRATRAASGEWAMVYLHHGGSVSVDTSRLAGNTLAVTWFNPRTGESQPGEGTGTAFEAPDDNDWVLILDAA
ncbi:MAG: glycoside hydrolase family 140 protein, partial [Pseudonocardia sp.]